MKIKRITALVLCALLVILTGCALIEVDEDLVQARENAKVIIEYNGETITKEYITMKMSAELAQYQQTLDDVMKDETYWSSYLEGFVRKTAIFRLALDQAAALGLDQLSEEEKAELDEQYNSNLEQLESFLGFYAQSAVDADPSLDYDEQYAIMKEDYLKSMGYTSSTYREQLEREYVFEKVREHYLSDIDITEDEMRSNYDTNVDLQKSNVELNPSFFEMQRGFGLVYYYPEGYMYVRHILVNYDSETRLSAIGAYSAGDMELFASFKEEGLREIQPKLDDIMSRLDAGESFDDLMEEYNEDSAFKTDPRKTEGEIVGPYSQKDIDGYIDAIGTLTREGQYTQPHAAQLGAYIIRCERLMGGAVPFEEIRDDIYNSMLYTQKESKWAELTREWIDAALESGTLKMHITRF